MENKELSDLLKRYKNGTASIAEQKLLEAWADARSESGSIQLTDIEKAKIGENLKMGIDTRIDNEKSNPGFSRWIWAAASIMLAIAITTFFYNRHMEPLPKETTYNQVTVPPGSTREIRLSDGSTVFLNGSTRITYPTKFTQNKREVTLLEGEAFFDIHHDTSKPFIVKTNGASIQVLGTAFNVKSYKTMEDTRVAVVRGKVAVNETSTSRRQVFLLPNEEAVVNKVSGDLKKTHINSKNVSGWTEGKLIFDNESLGNIAETLHHTKNITVHFGNDDIKDIRCTAGFDNRDEAKDIAFFLGRANGLMYSIKNNEIFLSRKAATSK